MSVSNERRNILLYYETKRFLGIHAALPAGKEIGSQPHSHKNQPYQRIHRDENSERGVFGCIGPGLGLERAERAKSWARAYRHRLLSDLRLVDIGFHGALHSYLVGVVPGQE